MSTNQSTIDPKHVAGSVRAPSDDRAEPVSERGWFLMGIMASAGFVCLAFWAVVAVVLAAVVV